MTDVEVLRELVVARKNQLEEVEKEGKKLKAKLRYTLNKIKQLKELNNNDKKTNAR